MAHAVVRGLLAAAGLAWALGAQPAAADESYVTPGSKAASLKSCVAPTEEMRRYHMEMIKHERHIIVHEGIRDTEYSLAGCIDCHVGKGPDNKPVSVYAEGQFCRRCHEYAAVELDCFDCHATVPTPTPGESAASGDLGAGMAQVSGQAAVAGGNTP